MKITVFGAGGFLGSAITRHLVDKGHAVSVFVRSDSAAARARAASAEVIRGDLANTASAVAAVDGAQAVVFAAQLLLEPERTTVRALLDSLAGTGAVFIFTSGTGVLSQRTDGDWSEDTFAEADQFTPSKYIGARVDTENEVLGFADRGVRTAIVRPGMIWGHGGCPMIREFYRGATKRGFVGYLGAGLNLYSNVHVDDVASLYGLIVDNDQANGIYHAVSGETNYRTLAQAVADDIGISCQSIDFSQAIDIWGKTTAIIYFSVCSRARAQRSRTELGWRPDPTRLDILTDIGHREYRTALAGVESTR